MAGFFYKGILLQQHKEPALSRNLREFLNADTIGIQMDRPPVDDPDKLTSRQIIDIARDAHIVDERDGLLLADKLVKNRRHPPRLLIADAIDDEPYISSQLNPLLNRSKEAELGLSLLMRACKASEAHFAVYKNLTDLNIRIPKAIGPYPVERIRGRYPAEYQASKIYSSTGVLAIGVCAAIMLARAVLYNKPQTTAFVTVAGDCIGNPTNLEVSLGMTIGQVLERCGLIEDPARVVIGGSMTGISVIDTDNTLVTPTTRAILAFRKDWKNMDFTCIGCSRCVHVCPEGLNPIFLYRCIKQKRFFDFRSLDAQMCVGCGTCSYMCPAKLDLSETIRRAAREFKPMSGSIRATSALKKKMDQAVFDSYMADYDYKQAQKAHKRALRDAAHALERMNRSDSDAFAQAKQAAEQALSVAQQIRLASEQAADHALAEAANTKKASETAAEQALANALQEKESALRTADQALSTAQKAKQSGEQAAEKRLSDALRQKEATQADADKTYQDALTAYARTKASAEKAYNKAQKNAKLSEDEKQALKKALDDIVAAQSGIEADAARLRDTAKVEAVAAYEQAQQLYTQTLTELAANYVAAEQAHEQASQIADEGYKTAQQVCEEAKAKASVEYQNAEAICAQAKEQAHQIYREAEQIHVQALKEAQINYEAACAKTVEQEQKTQAEIAQALEDARLHAEVMKVVAERAVRIFEHRGLEKFSPADTLDTIAIPKTPNKLDQAPETAASLLDRPAPAPELGAPTVEDQGSPDNTHESVPQPMTSDPAFSQEAQDSVQNSDEQAVILDALSDKKLETLKAESNRIDAQGETRVDAPVYPSYRAEADDTECSLPKNPDKSLLEAEENQQDEPVNPETDDSPADPPQPEPSQNAPDKLHGWRKNSGDTGMEGEETK